MALPKFLQDLLGSTKITSTKTDQGWVRKEESTGGIMEMIKKILGEKDVKAQMVPTPTPTPTATPQPTPEVTTPPTPNPWEQAGRPATNPYAEQMSAFGENAGNMERVLRWGEPDDQGYGANYGGENLSYNAEGDNQNSDGSIDRGLFQINSNTFADFLRRKGDVMTSLGITSFEDMKDPQKNIQMAKLILEEQGYGAWYGAPADLKP